MKPTTLKLRESFKEYGDKCLNVLGSRNCVVDSLAIVSIRKADTDTVTRLGLKDKTSAKDLRLVEEENVGFCE